MSHTKKKNKKAAMGMVASMLFASVMMVVLTSIDVTTLPQASLALPFGLQKRVGGLALAPFFTCISVGLTGLVLAVLPATLSRMKTLLAGFLLLTMATMFALFSRSPFELAGWSLLFGIGFTMHFCAWVSIGATFFPRHCAMMLGVMNFITAAGGIVGAKFAAILFAARDQYEALWLPGLAGLLVLVFLFMLITYLFRQISAVDKLRVTLPETVGVAVSLWSRGPLALCLATMCLPMAYYGLTAGYISYLREAMGFPLKTALLMVAVFMLSAFLSPLGAWLGDRYGHYKVLLIVLPMTGVMGGLMYMGWDIPLGVLMLGVFLAGFGVNAVFYVNVLAALIKSLAPLQSMRAAGLFFAAYTLILPGAVGPYSRLTVTLSWWLLGLLQVVGPLFLATLLVWLALKRPGPGSQSRRSIDSARHDRVS
jgi:MFS family permease